MVASLHHYNNETCTMTSIRFRPTLIALSLALATAGSAHAAIDLIAHGTLSGTIGDFSGLSAPLENGVAGDLLGGLGSGLAWAGGNTFLALPDRGPNATPWNTTIADTSSYIARFQTMTLSLTAASSGSLPYALTPVLTGTTLLYSKTPLQYAPANAANMNIAGTPSLNTANRFYFSGRSDNFGTGNSLDPSNGRLDPEGIRVSADGRSVFVSDEYGPYIYQFDRATGERIRALELPANLAVAHQGPTTASEGAPFNTTGRVANKGMEGLAITPDGTKLVGFMQSPLLQDGGDGGRANRIVTIDLATGVTKQFAYDNRTLDSTGAAKNFNSSEILALNDHEFLVLERDGKGLGDDSTTKLKSIFKVDIAGAFDVSGLTGEAALLAKAPTKSLFLDIKSVLNAHGFTDDLIPAKLEGMAFGEDLADGRHTLYIGNDNDFLATTPGHKANPNQWFVFAFRDGDLAGGQFVNQTIAAVPEPETYALMLAGLGIVGFAGVRRRKA